MGVRIRLMTFSIFTRSDMVINPGWLQIIDTVLVVISTCGVAYAMFGRFSNATAVDIGYRVLIAAVALLTMFHPNDTLAKWLVAVGLPLLVVGIWRHSKIASPKSLVLPPEAAVVEPGDLNQLAAEARRDIG